MKNWTDFLPDAALILAAEKALWPNCEGVMCGGAGSSDSRFSRVGTGTHVKEYAVPTSVSNMINERVDSANIDPNLVSQQNSLFSRLMSETPQAQPGFNQLTSAANLSVENFPGRTSLQNIANRDPYSGAYEAATLDAYKQRAGDAMAMAATGPEAVRGGDARTGIAQGTLASRLAQDRGNEVRNAQLQDTNAVLQASTGLAGAEAQRADTVTRSSLGLSDLVSGTANRGLEAGKAIDANSMMQLGLLQLASELQGQAFSKQSDNFSGRGNQSGWQAGLTCCFIFLQALNGKLPWYIEIARFDHYTPVRRRGYKWMSSWLVPQMQRRAWVQWLVNTVVIKPFLRYGAWLYKDPSAKRASALLAPYCKTWLAVWGAIGKVVKNGS